VPKKVCNFTENCLSQQAYLWGAIKNNTWEARREGLFENGNASFAMVNAL
jgi:hypothetical protein